MVALAHEEVAGRVQDGPADGFAVAFVRFLDTHKSLYRARVYHSGVRILRWDTWLRRAFVGASVAWAVLLPLTAFAASRLHAPSIIYAGAAAVYVVGSVLCHQLPERSFHLWGVQLPVCARCLGMYVGGAIAAVAAAAVARGCPASAREDAERAPARLAEVPAARRRQPSGRRSLERLALQTARVALAAAALPTIATLAYEWISGATPANGIRAMAGVPLGAIVAWLVVRQAHAPVASPEPADG